MFSLPKLVAAAGCLMALSAPASAQFSGTAAPPTDWLTGTTEEQLKTLAGIQPGVGTVMIEYSHRFGTMYYAAQGGNWKLADYQLKEMTEIQEVGETTRPARAKALKMFEEKSLNPIGEAIKGQNLKAFNVAFQAALKACNECHVDQKFAFIRYELPKSSPSPLSNEP
jgi:hypothetical protein